MRCLLALGLAMFSLALLACSEPDECWRQPPELPVDVTGADMYEDGGSVYVEFTDARGCAYTVARDGRMRIEPEQLDDPRCLYIGARHVTDDGAEFLDPDSELARGILAALLDWFDREFAPEAQAMLRSRVSVIGLTEREVEALRLLSFVRGLESRLCAKRAASN